MIIGNDWKHVLYWIQPQSIASKNDVISSDKLKRDAIEQNKINIILL